MYKVQLTNDCNFNVYGSIINVLDNAQTIYPNYNWIGTLSNKVMSLEDAFADLAPEKGDRIKNRTAQAEYRGNGIWEGTLKSIVWGQGVGSRPRAPSTGPVPPGACAIMKRP